MKFTIITFLVALLASFSLANPVNTETATFGAVNGPFDDCQQCTDYYNKCRKVREHSLPPALSPHITPYSSFYLPSAFAHTFLL
jgi:hypothetical protein